MDKEFLILRCSWCVFENDLLISAPSEAALFKTHIPWYILTIEYMLISSYSLVPNLDYWLVSSFATPHPLRHDVLILVTLNLTLTAGQKYNDTKLLFSLMNKSIYCSSVIAIRTSSSAVTVNSLEDQSKVMHNEYWKLDLTFKYDNELLCFKLHIDMKNCACLLKRLSSFFFLFF